MRPYARATSAGVTREPSIGQHVHGILFALDGRTKPDVQAARRDPVRLHTTRDPPVAAEEFNEAVGLPAQKQ